MNKNLPIVIIGLVAIVAIVGGVFLYRSSTAKTNVAANNSNVSNSSNISNSNGAATPSPATDRMKTAPAGAQPAWSRGDANAVVTLEEFADFECPSCAAFQATLKEIKTIYGNRVKIIFRQYPLTQMHPKAYDAARATEAAGAQGKFWEMQELIYDRQKDWKVSPDHRKDFTDYAKTLGLDVDKFNADLTGDTANRRVALDKQRGDNVGVKATPSLFLNNRLLTPDEMETSKLRQAIDSVLQTAQTPPPATVSSPAQNSNVKTAGEKPKTGASNK